MKWFADGYDTDEVEPKVKKLRELDYQYKFFRLHSDLGWPPSLDLCGTEKELIMLVDLAGMEGEDVVIRVGR
jgi:HSP20 family molecular chaperone IbpA